MATRETHTMIARRERFRQRRDAIADALRAGRTYAEIGAEFSITRERVRQIAKLYGLERRKANRPKDSQDG